MKKTILLRKSVQIAFLTLFLITVLQANYPFKPWVPPELFLWLDPLAGITTMIAARSWIPWFLLALIVLLSPLIVGRGFCGWVCPLGTTIDITDKLVAPRKNPKKAKVRRRFSHWKTFMLVFFLITAMTGLQYTWLMDPLPLLWRTFGAVIFPGMTFLLNGLLDLILKLGILADRVQKRSRGMQRQERGIRHLRDQLRLGEGAGLGIEVAAINSPARPFSVRPEVNMHRGGIPCVRLAESVQAPRLAGLLLVWLL